MPSKAESLNCLWSIFTDHRALIISSRANNVSDCGRHKTRVLDGMNAYEPNFANLEPSALAPVVFQPMQPCSELPPGGFFRVEVHEVG